VAIRVLIADDHAVLRDGLRRLLESSGELRVVGATGDGLTAVEMALAQEVEIVVMDVAMPGLNGIAATQAILERLPRAGVVMLSMHSSPEIVRQALLAGARGYLLKESAGDEVVLAVQAVAAGGRYLGQGVAEPGSPGAGGLGALTRRELEVLRLVVEGKSNAEAGGILGLSPRSVETYRARLMQKLAVEDLPSLVKLAIRHGLTALK
jgi:DNA-binding NarL/FixJ family response regulator